jgi:hypothetical protein
VTRVGKDSVWDAGRLIAEAARKDKIEAHQQALTILAIATSLRGIDQKLGELVAVGRLFVDKLDGVIDNLRNMSRKDGGS